MYRTDGIKPVPSHMQRWQYNCLDADIDREVFEVLEPRFAADPEAARLLGFLMHQQAPAFAMQQRGIKIDEAAIEEAERAHVHNMEEALAELNRIAPPAAIPQVPNPKKCTLTANGAHRWSRDYGAAFDPKLDYCVRCLEPRKV